MATEARAAPSPGAPGTPPDRPEAPSASRLPHIAGLDGVRGLAVLLVIAFHGNYLGFGWVGVQLFFVLSGFLITRNLLADRAGRSLSQFLRDFYVRRSARIFPLYFGYLAVLTVLWAATGRPTAFGNAALSLYTYTFNFTRLTTTFDFSPFFGHFWSLAIEEQFYLAWPFIVWALGPRGLKVAVAALIFGAPLVRFVMAGFLRARGFPAVDVVEGINTFTLAQIDAFAVGAAIPVFGLERLGRRAVTVLWGALVLVVLAGAAQYSALVARAAPLEWTSLGYPQPMQADLQVLWGTSALNAASAALVLALFAARPGWSLFEWRWLRSMGQVSYGMYVFHLPAIRLTSELLPVTRSTAAAAVVFGVLVAVIWGVAAISYRYFEGPILTWARARTLTGPVAPRRSSR